MEPPGTVARLWDEIDAWFDEHGATHNIAERRPGASAPALERLERTLGVALPTDLRASLAVHDGGGDFDGYTYLGTAGIADTWSRWHAAAAAGELAHRAVADDTAHHRWWEDSWIPFAADSAGNLLCADGASRSLVTLETQDAQGAFVTPGRGFADWLRSYRDALVGGGYEVDAEGFVGEPVVPPSVVAAAAPPAELDRATGDAVEAAIRGDDPARLAELLAGVAPGTALTFARSLLGVAAEAGHLRIVDLLLDRGEDVDAGEAQGERTPLYQAVWGMTPRPDVVRRLLDRGAHVNALTRYDGTALHGAVMWDQLDALELLLRHGADVTIRDAAGRTALDLARGRPVERLLTGARRDA